MTRVVSAGRFSAPIADLNTAHWDGNGGLLSRRRLQRKSWLYGGVFSERWIVGCAIIDAGLLGSAFIYIFDRETRQFTEHTAIRPLVFPANFQPSPTAPWSFTSGQKSWRIQPLTNTAGWQFEFTNGKSTDEIDVSFELQDNGASISALNNPPSSARAKSHRPFHYTHKLTGTPAQLRLHINGVQHEVKGISGVFDFTLGYPPRSTLWQWASWTGQLDDGRQLSGNLVAQTLNGLENAVWLGNAEQVTAIAMPQAIFDYNPHDTMQPWRIRSADGRLDMQFVPEGARSEAIHLGILASDFTQPFGAFHGVWRDEDGSEHTLTGMGVVEQHRALW